MENLIENKIEKILAILKDENVTKAEKLNYRKILSRLCLKHKVDINKIIEKQQELKSRKINFVNDEADLVLQTIFKVIGNKNRIVNVTKKKYKNRFYFFEATESEFLEINELLDFVLNIYRKEKEILVNSLIYKYKLFSEKVFENTEKCENKLTDYEISRIIENMQSLPDKNLKLNQ